MSSSITGSATIPSVNDNHRATIADDAALSLLPFPNRKNDIPRCQSNNSISPVKPSNDTGSSSCRSARTVPLPSTPATAKTSQKISIVTNDGENAAKVQSLGGRSDTAIGCQSLPSSPTTAKRAMTMNDNGEVACQDKFAPNSVDRITMKKAVKQSFGGTDENSGSRTNCLSTTTGAMTPLVGKKQIIPGTPKKLPPTLLNFWTNKSLDHSTSTIDMIGEGDRSVSPNISHDTTMNGTISSSSVTSKNSQSSPPPGGSTASLTGSSVLPPKFGRLQKIAVYTNNNPGEIETIPVDSSNYNSCSDSNNNSNNNSFISSGTSGSSQGNSSGDGAKSLTKSPANGHFGETTSVESMLSSPPSVLQISSVFSSPALVTVVGCSSTSNSSASSPSAIAPVTGRPAQLSKTSRLQQIALYTSNDQQNPGAIETVNINDGNKSSSHTAQIHDKSRCSNDTSLSSTKTHLQASFTSARSQISDKSALSVPPKTSPSSFTALMEKQRQKIEQSMESEHTSDKGKQSPNATKSEQQQWQGQSQHSSSVDSKKDFESNMGSSFHTESTKSSPSRNFNSSKDSQRIVSFLASLQNSTSSKASSISSALLPRDTIMNAKEECDEDDKNYSAFTPIKLFHSYENPGDTAEVPNGIADNTKKDVIGKDAGTDAPSFSSSLPIDDIISPIHSDFCQTSSSLVILESVKKSPTSSTSTTSPASAHHVVRKFVVQSKAIANDSYSSTGSNNINNNGNLGSIRTAGKHLVQSSSKFLYSSNETKLMKSEERELEEKKLDEGYTDHAEPIKERFYQTMREHQKLSLDKDRQNIEGARYFLNQGQYYGSSSDFNEVMEYSNDAFLMANNPSNLDDNSLYDYDRQHFLNIDDYGEGSGANDCPLDADGLHTSYCSVVPLSNMYHESPANSKNTYYEQGRNTSEPYLQERAVQDGTIVFHSAGAPDDFDPLNVTSIPATENSYNHSMNMSQDEILGSNESFKLHGMVEEQGRFNRTTIDIPSTPERRSRLMYQDALPEHWTPARSSQSSEVCTGDLHFGSLDQEESEQLDLKHDIDDVLGPDETYENTGYVGRPPKHPNSASELDVQRINLGDRGVHMYPHEPLVDDINYYDAAAEDAVARMMAEVTFMSMSPADVNINQQISHPRNRQHTESIDSFEGNTDDFNFSNDTDRILVNVISAATEAVQHRDAGVLSRDNFSGTSPARTYHRANLEDINAENEFHTTSVTDSDRGPTPRRKNKSRPKNPDSTSNVSGDDASRGRYETTLSRTKKVAKKHSKIIYKPSKQAPKKIRRMDRTNGSDSNSFDDEYSVPESSEKDESYIKQFILGAFLDFVTPDENSVSSRESDDSSYSASQKSMSSDNHYKEGSRYNHRQKVVRGRERDSRHVDGSSDDRSSLSILQEWWNKESTAAVMKDPAIKLPTEGIDEDSSTDNDCPKVESIINQELQQVLAGENIALWSTLSTKVGEDTTKEINVEKYPDELISALTEKTPLERDDEDEDEKTKEKVKEEYTIEDWLVSLTKVLNNAHQCGTSQAANLEESYRIIQSHTFDGQFPKKLDMKKASEMAKEFDFMLPHFKSGMTVLRKNYYSESGFSAPSGRSDDSSDNNNLDRSNEAQVSDVEIFYDNQNGELNVADRMPKPDHRLDASSGKEESAAVATVDSFNALPTVNSIIEDTARIEANDSLDEFLSGQDYSYQSSYDLVFPATVMRSEGLADDTVAATSEPPMSSIRSRSFFANDDTSVASETRDSVNSADEHSYSSGSRNTGSRKQRITKLLARRRKHSVARAESSDTESLPDEVLRLDPSVEPLEVLKEDPWSEKNESFDDGVVSFPDDKVMNFAVLSQAQSEHDLLSMKLVNANNGFEQFVEKPNLQGSEDFPGSQLLGSHEVRQQSALKSRDRMLQLSPIAKLCDEDSNSYIYKENSLPKTFVKDREIIQRDCHTRAERPDTRGEHPDARIEQSDDRIEQIDQAKGIVEQEAKVVQQKYVRTETLVASYEGYVPLGERPRIISEKQRLQDYEEATESFLHEKDFNTEVNKTLIDTDQSVLQTSQQWEDVGPSVFGDLKRKKLSSAGNIKKLEKYKSLRSRFSVGAVGNTNSKDEDDDRTDCSELNPVPTDIEDDPFRIGTSKSEVEETEDEQLDKLQAIQSGSTNESESDSTLCSKPATDKNKRTSSKLLRKAVQVNLVRARRMMRRGNLINATENERMIETKSSSESSSAISNPVCNDHRIIGDNNFIDHSLGKYVTNEDAEGEPNARSTLVSEKDRILSSSVTSLQNLVPAPRTVVDNLETCSGFKESPSSETKSFDGLDLETSSPPNLDGPLPSAEMLVERCVTPDRNEETNGKALCSLARAVDVSQSPRQGTSSPENNIPTPIDIIMRRSMISNRFPGSIGVNSPSRNYGYEPSNHTQIPSPIVANSMINASNEHPGESAPMEKSLVSAGICKAYEHLSSSSSNSQPEMTVPSDEFELPNELMPINGAPEGSKPQLETTCSFDSAGFPVSDDPIRKKSRFQSDEERKSTTPPSSIVPLGDGNENITESLVRCSSRDDEIVASGAFSSAVSSDEWEDFTPTSTPFSKTEVSLSRISPYTTESADVSLSEFDKFILGETPTTRAYI